MPLSPEDFRSKLKLVVVMHGKSEIAARDFVDVIEAAVRSGELRPEAVEEVRKGCASLLEAQKAFQDQADAMLASGDFSGRSFRKLKAKQDAAVGSHRQFDGLCARLRTQFSTAQ